MLRRVPMVLLLWVVGCGRSPVWLGGWSGDGGGGELPDLGEGSTEACAQWDTAPSSAGCSFVLAHHADVIETVPEGLMVANPSPDQPATVVLSHVPGGSRTAEPIGAPVVLAAGQTFLFELTAEASPDTGSHVRTGGVFVVQSDRPITAHQHAPASTTTGNDATLLLPLEALGRDYVAHSYPARTSLEPYGHPSYFDVIGLEDGTEVEWVPREAPTAGDGSTVPEVDVGELGRVELQRYDVLRISAVTTGPAAILDVSGTSIRANRSIAVVSGCRCAQVPANEDYPPFAGCDPLLEQLVPLAQWGTSYVAARAPLRDAERHHWRIHGSPGVTVWTDPALPQTPHTFEEVGEHIELEVEHGQSFEVRADGPVMPVQYLQSAYLPQFGLSRGTARGDPAMLQTVPTSRFLRRYVVAPPTGFAHDVLQIVHRVAGADVRVDGVVVGDYVPVSASWELADVPVTSGPHVAESDEPFGLVQVGFTDDGPNAACTANTDEDVCFSSYAYVGGLALGPS